MLERNYRTREGEIDLIAVRDGTLVFCEVKTLVARPGGQARARLSAGGVTDRQAQAGAADARVVAGESALASAGAAVPRHPLRRDRRRAVAAGKLLRLEHVEAAFYGARRATASAVDRELLVRDRLERAAVQHADPVLGDRVAVLGGRVADVGVEVPAGQLLGRTCACSGRASPSRPPTPRRSRRCGRRRRSPPPARRPKSRTRKPSTRQMRSRARRPARGSRAAPRDS